MTAAKDTFDPPILLASGGWRESAKQRAKILPVELNEPSISSLFAAKGSLLAVFGPRNVPRANLRRLGLQRHSQVIKLIGFILPVHGNEHRSRFVAE